MPVLETEAKSEEVIRNKREFRIVSQFRIRKLRGDKAM